MKNKILLLGLFCCSLISAKAQVLLDKGTGKNSFPIVSSVTNAVVCFDGKDATVVRKSASLFVDDVRRVTGQELKMDESKPGRVSARYAIYVLHRSFTSKIFIAVSFLILYWLCLRT